ncbi:MAG: hypothetical protein K2X48_14205 [Chitinophagaceae bacterium]|nr:hypothetical protein [Chitinophagaceae bacterium]
MNFDFLPYPLNSSLRKLESNLAFDSRNNEVDFYKVLELPVQSIFEMPITSIALYFHRNKLITAYYRLNTQYASWEQVVTSFEAYLAKDAMCWEEDEGNLYNWKLGNQFLGILASKSDNTITIYHTYKRYNVFEDI